MAIDRITSVAPAVTPKTPPTTTTGATGAADFGAALKDMIGAVESSTSSANQAVGQMLNGTGDVHEAMIALQRADMMLQLTVQIRNKLVQAYQDVMRMPV